MKALLRHIKLGTRVAAAKLTKKRVPFFVQLAPTSMCNLKCRYCFAQFHEREKAYFPYPALKQVVEGLADLGTKFIMLTGGEPMMYPQIIPLIKLISQHRIECLLNTNGLLVLDRMNELEGVDIYSISLDGPRALNDYYRGEGTYDRILEVIAEVRRRGKRVQLQFTMTRDLKVAFQHVNDIAEEFGCFIGINFLRPQKQVSGGIISPDEVTQEEIKEFLDWLIREKPRTVPYPTRILKYVRQWPFDFSRHLISRQSDLQGFQPIPCASCRYIIAIEHQGNIYPCTKWFYSKPLSNCADGDIKKAWKNLSPVKCMACLDLGFNLLNDTIRFHPSSMLGLLSSFRRKSDSCREK